MYCYRSYFRTRWVKLKENVWYDYDSHFYYNEKSKYFAYYVPQTQKWWMWNGKEWLAYDATAFNCEGIVLLGVCSGSVAR